MKRWPIAADVVALLAGSWIGAGPTGTSSPSPTAVPVGGTLRVDVTVAVPSFFQPTQPTILDPQFEFSYEGCELFRCCLLRTLLFYNSRPTNEGRADYGLSRPCPSSIGSP